MIPDFHFFILAANNVPLVLSDSCWKGDLLASASLKSSHLDNLGVVVNLSKHSEFAVLDRRQATFLTYPYGNSKDTGEMVEAGYFYSGKNIKLVKQPNICLEKEDFR